MKRFLKIMFCLLLCVFTILPTACGKNDEDDGGYFKGDVNAPVVGNGGMAVRKGNYLYFVNGFKTTDSGEHEQGKKDYQHGALMATKIDANGNLKMDEYCATVSSKLCGFEATNLFIGGNYLYFASPCQENEGGEDAGNNSEVWAKYRVVFYRINLNGEEKVQELYTSQIRYDELEYEYYYNGSTYLLIYENGTNLDDSNISKRLIRLNCDQKDAEAEQIAIGVSSVVMPENGNNVLFVTSDSVDETTYYNLNKYSVFSNSTTRLDREKSEFTAKMAGNDYAYATYTDSQSRVVLNRYAYADREEKVISYNGNLFKDFYLTENDQIIATYIPEANSSNKSAIMLLNQENVTENLLDQVVAFDNDATSLTVVGVTNGCVVYLDNSNNVKVVSYDDHINDREVTVNTLIKVENLRTDYIDLDENYLYFFKGQGSHDYVYRLNVTNNFGQPAEFVGIYESGDAPVEE